MSPFPFSVLYISSCLLFCQNGSLPKDVAYQQGFQAVAELLEEYERRLREGPEVPSDAADAETKEESDCSPGAEGGEKGLVKNGIKTNGLGRGAGQPPMYQDVIPSPRHSPLCRRARKGLQESPKKGGP